MSDKTKLIESILENFDFNKVKKTMKFLNWTWSTTPEPDSVPSLYQLISSAKEKLEEAYNRSMNLKKNTYSDSGGFQVLAEYNKELGAVDYLQLDFVLTTWDESI